MGEVFTLAKMLFGRKPSEIEKVSLLGMDHFPFRGYKYLMWCGRMIYRNDMYDRRQKEWPTDAFKVSENHEQIHLMQAKAAGSWVKYYWRYFIEWLKGNPLVHPSTGAYYTVPYECEAYANEQDMDYTRNYDESNLTKYTLKYRKRLYRSLGCNAHKFKEYLKSL